MFLVLLIVTSPSPFAEWAQQQQQQLRLGCTQVINERDILGTQLIRRNDELALLYEKLKIQQSTLKKVWWRGKPVHQKNQKRARVVRPAIFAINSPYYFLVLACLFICSMV